MSGDPLERPVLSMLTGPQAALARNVGRAVRIDPTYGPFAAALDTSPEAQAALAGFVVESDAPIWLVEPEAWPAPPGTRVERTAPLVQMLADGAPGHTSQDLSIEPLGEGDLSQMRRLAEATKPGPWGSNTHLYGQFFGVKSGGELAAMAGERMRPAARLAEVSGVCTWPAFRGRGFARALIAHVMAAQHARGDQPFLHSYAGNEGAIALYESLGFRIVRNLVVTVLAKA